MAKVTSKLQVTVPKAVADRLAIKPGDDLQWRVEGQSARVSREPAATPRSLADRLAIFDESTRRQEARDRARRRSTTRKPAPRARGWTREDLYTRGRAR